MIKSPIFSFYWLILFWALSHDLSSQNIISIREPHFPYALNKVDTLPNTYKLIEPYRTATIEFRTDGSFLYQEITSRGFELCVGKYYVNKPIIKLIWDSISTYELLKDTVATRKLFRFKKATPVKPLPTIFKLKEKSIESMTLKYDKVELLFLSDLYKKGPVLDSLISIQYTTFHQKNITIKRVSKKDLAFKKDSIWGFRIYKDGHYKTYRNDPIVLKWNMFPGVQIAHVENGFIVYMVENSTKTYYYYFGKTLDSEIFLLDKTNLDREYSDFPKFLELVHKEFKLGINYGIMNEITHNFKIVEMYRAR